VATANVSVVVVTYNSAQWIERCLESVRGYETIVVDHGSSDGTVEIVRRRFPEVRVIEEENIGMGGGNNAGAGFPNGRRPQDDVIDIELSIITNGALTTGDSVNGNELPFRNSFPFFAPSHTPLPPGTTDDKTRH